MVRLMGEKKNDDARKVASYSIAISFIAALIFSLLILIFMKPLLYLLGASENTFEYGRQYLIATAVIGGIPTVLAMDMPMLLRNAGYSKEAGIGVALGGIFNILLDPLFMFVLLPEGNEVLGAGIATMLSNIISCLFFVVVFKKVGKNTILELPKRLEHIGPVNVRSFYSVGIPAAFAVFLFDLVTMVINKQTAAYGDIHLAAIGIVLKLERIPLNVGLGICLGMVPLVAYNYTSGDHKRMYRFVSLARIAILAVSFICIIAFWFFAKQITGAFIDDEETVAYGVTFLKGRCFAMPFMLIGYHVVNFMNAIGKGKVSFGLAILRHLILIIPILFIMKAIWGLDGLVWSQVVADVLNAVVASVILLLIMKGISSDSEGKQLQITKGGNS